MTKSKVQLEQEINENEPVTYLSGEYRITLDDTEGFFISGKYVRTGITLTAGNKIIDGKDAKIIFEIMDDPVNSVSLFSILKNIRNLTLCNLNINIKYSGEASKTTICCVNNNSYKLRIEGCQLNFFAEKQISFTAVYNEGSIDTTLDTPADNLWMSNNDITARSQAALVDFETTICGINNHLANSVCITNNYLFIQNNGIGEKQKAYGIINSGRYARIENNNIKANGSHNVGKLLEAAHTCGVLNSGEYMIFSGNNCVGEWGGRCVGVHNFGNCSTITANKILSTHTIKGRTVIIEANSCVLANNIITTTSRNPHLVEIRGSYNNVTGNLLQGLFNLPDGRSGVGIWVEGFPNAKITGCNINGNIINRLPDYGIVLLHAEKTSIQNNQFNKFADNDEYMSIYMPTGNSDNVVINNIAPKDGNGGNNLSRNFENAIVSLSIA